MCKHTVCRPVNHLPPGRFSEEWHKVLPTWANYPAKPKFHLQSKKGTRMCQKTGVKTVLHGQNVVGLFSLTHSTTDELVGLNFARKVSADGGKSRLANES